MKHLPGINSGERVELPEVQQSIAVCTDLSLLSTLGYALEDSAVAGVVVRQRTYGDFEADLLLPLQDQHQLPVAERVEFKRETAKKFDPHIMSEREILHLDIRYPLKGDRPFFPYAMTIGRITLGQAVFAAAPSSGRVRGWTEREYRDHCRSLNLTRPMIGLHESLHEPWFNASYDLRHRGLRGPVGAIALQTGDVFIVAQGAGKSKAPSWHAVITPPSSRRESVSYHLRPTATKSQAANA